MTRKQGSHSGTVSATPLAFKFFRQFDAENPPAWLGSQSALCASDAARFFGGSSLQDKLARQLAYPGGLPIKEIIECCEMFARIRKQTRASVVADACCGHGLLGILFALFERQVEQVILIDRQRPPNHDKLMAAIDQRAPWVRPKITYLTSGIDPMEQPLPKGTSVVAAHACGVLTDRCLDLALTTQGAVAVMPCCYPKRTCPAPRSLVQSLGLGTAYDVHRTYRLEEAGYTTHWSSIPSVITPMNRILMAHPPRVTGSSKSAVAPTLPIA